MKMFLIFFLLRSGLLFQADENDIKKRIVHQVLYMRKMIIIYSCWYCAASKIQESRGPLERRRRENSSVPETEQKHNLKGPTSASVKQYSDIHPVVQMSKNAFLKIHNRGRHGAVRARGSTWEHVSVWRCEQEARLPPPWRWWDGGRHSNHHNNDEMVSSHRPKEKENLIWKYELTSLFFNSHRQYFWVSLFNAIRPMAV